MLLLLLICCLQYLRDSRIFSAISLVEVSEADNFETSTINYGGRKLLLLI